MEIVRREGPEEIIVSDGGSIDRTLEIATSFQATIVQSFPPHRAIQLNTGASVASGDILLFLHADTRLPSGALQHIRNRLQSKSVVGGAFTRWFDSPSLFLKGTCALAALRNRAFGWHLGDQAMFVRAHSFHQLNGFPVYECFEDLEFSRRLGRIGKVVTLRPGVVTSARRFQAGPLKRTVRDFLMTVRYLSGDISLLRSMHSGAPLKHDH